MGTRPAASFTATLRTSVVFVLVGRWAPTDDAHAPLRLPDGRAFIHEGTGLGFVFGTPNYIFTCAHVIEGREPQDVLVFQRSDVGRMRLMDGFMWDSGVDVALLHTPEPFSVPTLPARQGHRVWLGEDAHFWTPMIHRSPDGQVFGMSLCLRRTMVSSIQDPSTTQPSAARLREIVIDAVVSGGSSGSPLICSHGLLGGMVFAEQMRPDGGYTIPAGMGWALPLGALFEAAAFFAERERLRDLQMALSLGHDDG